MELLVSSYNVGDHINTDAELQLADNICDEDIPTTVTPTTPAAHMFNLEQDKDKSIELTHTN